MENFKNSACELYVRAMGAELGQVFSELLHEVAFLNSKWQIYENLFSHSKERIALLNKISAQFFGILQEILLGDLHLHIAKLTSAIKSNRQKNLTIRQLPDLLNESLLPEIEPLINSSIELCMVSSTWRNKKFAHIDYDHALEYDSTLPEFSRSDIEKAVNAISAVINRINLYYFNSEIKFKSDKIEYQSVDRIIQYLNMGLKAEEAIKSRP